MPDEDKERPHVPEVVRAVSAESQGPAGCEQRNRRPQLLPQSRSVVDAYHLVLHERPSHALGVLRPSAITTSTSTEASAVHGKWNFRDVLSLNLVQARIRRGLPCSLHALATVASILLFYVPWAGHVVCNNEHVDFRCQL